MSEWNKQIANSLMGYAASDPSTANVRNSLMDVVTNRATFFPAADYADGSTRWAWPGALYEPAAAWSRMMGGDASPANAMTVAGSAMAGALPFAPRGALGSAGGKLKLYHGSPKLFDKFDGSEHWFSSSEHHARDFGKDRSGLMHPRFGGSASAWDRTRPNMYEIEVDSNALATVRPFEEAIRLAKEIGVPEPERWDDAAAILQWGEAQRLWLDEAKQGRRGGVLFKDVGDVPGGDGVSDHVAIFDPALINILRRY